MLLKFISLFLIDYFDIINFMKIIEEEIWRYENKDKTQVIVLHEIEKGLLINYPQGNINLDGVKELFKFLNEYNKINNKKIILLIDNTKLQSIAIKARLYVIKFIKKNVILKKAVTYGKNLFIRNFMNLFTSIMNKVDLTSYSFETKEEALKWIIRNKLND